MPRFEVTVEKVDQVAYEAYIFVEADNEDLAAEIAHDQIDSIPAHEWDEVDRGTLDTGWSDVRQVG